ncbi:MAG: CRTAC1 family protein [Acidobacteria bacterium]|nr:CRTAC1 family protein [Acidobacteriota bacterium]
MRHSFGLSTRSGNITCRVRFGCALNVLFLLHAGAAWGQTIRFRDAGIGFVLENGATPEKHVIETMVGGVAAFDFDGDGLTDIFFANGATSPGLLKTGEKFSNRLFRNLGGFRFKDVTAEAGLAGEGYCHGVAAADFDNDGRVDLFVTGVRGNRLYRNLGGGRFEDVTAKAGVGGGLWSIGAGWFDFDNDGLLDLFVANYLEWSPDAAPYCGDPARGIRSYCHPRNYRGLANALYRNRGDGTFEDVSAKSGIAAHVGKAMSVSFADYDGDGRMDVFVTNDKMPNSLFHNLGGGKFEEVAFELGVALPDHGRDVSGMGSDFRDYDNDGRPDIVFAALAGETFPLFRNAGATGFRGWGRRSGLDVMSLRRSGWSPALADLNNDGWKDLFVSGAHVSDNVEMFEAAHYKAANFVAAGSAGGVFHEVPMEPELQRARAHRGAAFADFNNDGRVDAVVSVIGERAELWENVTAGGGSWLTLKLHGTRSNRDGIGAEVRIGSQVNHMTTSVGYASSSHAGVHFGLGSARVAERVEIRWPSGVRQVLTNVAANRAVDVTEPAK